MSFTAHTESPAGPVSGSARRKGHTVLFCATEPLDASGADHFLERARPLLPGCQCLVVDLRRSVSIDTAGVSALVQLLAEVQMHEKALRLIAPQGGGVAQTLQRLDLLGQFQVFETLADAWDPEVPRGRLRRLGPGFATATTD
jgi:anti-anti-sigma regulatory factor